MIFSPTRILAWARGLLLAALWAPLVAAAPALAQSPLLYEAKFGVLYHDVPMWSRFSLEKGGVDLNVDVTFAPAMQLWGGTLRPAVGGTWNTAGYTSKAFIDARWRYETVSGIYFGVGLGAAIHDGHTDIDALDRKALGSRVLFHIPFEIGYYLDRHNSISLYFEHMSNGYTQRYNEGLDSIGLRYGYRF